MIFNLEKYFDNNSQEKEIPDSEKTQEQLDKEILEEANNLGVTLEQLEADINSFGGIEKFKEFWEKSGESNSQNLAGEKVEELRSLESDMFEKKDVK